jgi:hypothetical protein
VTYIIGFNEIKCLPYTRENYIPQERQRRESPGLLEKNRIHSIEYGGIMMIFFAFLAGFYVGVFAISLLVVAGRRKEKEKEAIDLPEQPQMRQMALF